MKDMSNSGFTLIELMIVLAVIGILAAIAYPLYQGSLSKARRTDAQTVMLELALWMERFYTEHHRYDATNSDPPVAVTSRIPAGLTRSPKEGNPRHYSLGLTDLSRLTFTIAATPIPEGVQADDDCGTLTLAHTGAKGVGGAATLPAEDCW